MTDWLEGRIEEPNFLDPAGHFDGKKEGGTTTATPNLPPALQQLIGQSAGRLGTFQNALWRQMMPNNGAGYDRDDLGLELPTDAGDDDRTYRNPWLPEVPPIDVIDGDPVEGDIPWWKPPVTDTDPTDDSIFDRYKSNDVTGSSKQSGLDLLRSLLEQYQADPDQSQLVGTEVPIDPPEPGGEVPPWAGIDVEPGGRVPNLDAHRPGDWISWMDWAASPDGILGDNSRQIVGTNPALEGAMERIWGMQRSPEELLAARGVLDDMRGVSQRQATGEGLQEDPAFLAANKAFQDAMLPMIQNQAALSGLGRSTAMTNASAAQQAQTLLPMTQDYLGRQERSIDRELGTLGQQFSGLTGLGDRSYGRRTDQIGNLLGMGDYGRQVGQQQSDARYNDWLRRAGLFEQSLTGPSGLFGSTIGGTTTTDKGGKG